MHLIRCDEVVPGTKKLSDLTGPIDEALAKELLEKISAVERQQTPVKYTVRLAALQAGDAGVGKIARLPARQEGHHGGA